MAAGCAAAPGGNGGQGGELRVELVNSVVTTQGGRSVGVSAISRGGLGGEGGFSTESTGGFGGNGGRGGVVTVDLLNGVEIQTSGLGSHGVWAQSLGGSAGNGGSGGNEGGSGGRGGTGGSSQAVTVKTAATVSTRGQDAYGVYAGSLAGKAGAGGGAGTGGTGGEGGAASSGGAVELRNAGTVSTQGASSHALFAQNIGGGGVTAGASGSEIGGRDANGVGSSTGGAVTLFNLGGALTTRGTDAIGLLAQSIGGGGGEGGSSGGIFSVGGKGGTGGKGGDITAQNTGRILTYGERASAMHVQSIGGGGGTMNIIIGVGGGIGGASAAGGHGGNVLAQHQGGTLQTQGQHASALFAQSVGGGGGTAGSVTSVGVSVATLTIGGQGGGGGDGGKVTVQARDGDILTSGAGAYGIDAQSVGGGGGNGGSATAQTLAIPTSKGSLAATFAVGGEGSGGGIGGLVTVDNLATVQTLGDGARGIFAQSVGGGGGSGGSASATSVSVAPGKSLALSLAIGGSGAGGGAGGEVRLDNRAFVGTAGHTAHALMAQSVGGGGGTGGAGSASAEASGAQAYSLTFTVGGKGGGGGDGNRVTVSNNAWLSTSGAHSRGMMAQSVGGGGGDAGGADGDAQAERVAPAITLGASGGRGGKGGDVTVVNMSGAFIESTGRGADGVFAQSVGGGGGTGSVVGSVSAIEAEERDEKTGKPGKAGGPPAAKSSHTVAATFTLGGSGGVGGDGGKVDVFNNGYVLTSGEQAAGLFAQSVGGGGGKAGSAKSSATGGSISINAALGGSGGAAGRGGDVTVVNSGVVQTLGEGAYALFAQSVGGGGGVATGSESNTQGARLAVDLSFGGHGGGGGDGGVVKVTNAGQLITYGETALFAQSVGGGGGAGGVTDGVSEVVKPDEKEADKQAVDAKTRDEKPAVKPAGGAQPAAQRSGAVTLGFGGDGGTAGRGGVVTVDNTGWIWTQSDHASGIFAQSVGGGGGAGGSSNGAAKGGDVNIRYNLGGKGGSSGSGGNVTVNHENQIQTTGLSSYGIFAQSVGGGGGAGASAEGATSGSVSLGGSHSGAGGMGRFGGTVTVNLKDALIETWGASSSAVFAQSVGGGGGTAGSATAATEQGEGKSVALNLALGSTGGQGGHGGMVMVNQRAGAHLITHGDDAEGIRAQSIGGGGGAASVGTVRSVVPTPQADDGGDPSGAEAQAEGGAAPSGGGADAGGQGGKDGKEEKPPRQHNFGVALGGSGGASGQGGVVSVNLAPEAGTRGEPAGSIRTQGDRSTAVLLQSVGGGGGKAAAGAAEAGYGSVSVDFVLGGSGGAAGNGGTVTFTNSWTLNTAGVNAHGVHAQSIGGGGGIAGGASAQSGGQAKVALGAVVGGAGGQAGNGGSVMLDNRGNIHTRGEASYAMFGQSIGGGGGYSASATVEREKQSAGELLIGRAGGAGGDGGAVTVTHGSQGVLTTAGRGAHAIVAQSVGGGGGAGGTTEGDNKLVVRLGGGGGNGGKGGDVLVSAAGSIQTRGLGAYGILAQSVGGGGGFAGDSALMVFGKEPIRLSQPAAGARGSGGNVLVRVDRSGVVETHGGRATAIVAQSVGGGGGLGAQGMGSGGSTDQRDRGGEVTVWVDGQVRAHGENASAIVAQSTGGGGAASDIEVNVGRNGLVQGGTGPYGYGVLMMQGQRNLLTIEHGGVLSSRSGHTIRAMDVPESMTVRNAGTLYGGIDFGQVPQGRVVNEPTGLFHTGEQLQLGKSGVLENAGILHVGMPSSYTTTHLTGRYEQAGPSLGEGAGVYRSDVDFRGQRAGVLSVTGPVHLDGAVRALGRYQLPRRTVKILESTQPIQVAPTLALDNTLLYSYRLHDAGSRALSLSVNADFTKYNGELNEDQASLASYLQGRWNGGAPEALYEFAEVFDHFSQVQTLEEYRSGLSSVANDAKLAAAASVPQESRHFINLALSCPEFQGEGAAMQEGNCFWARVMNRSVRRDATGEDQGYSNHGMIYQVGGQKVIAPGWVLGGSLAYGDGRVRAAGGPVRTDARQFNAAVVLKREIGPWLFAGALNVGQGHYETRRSLRVGGETRTAKSDWKSTHAAVRLRGQYTHAMSNWYLKPIMDLDIAYQRVPAYRESGAGAFNLEMDASSRWNVMLSPALEIGGRIDVKGATLRPYVSVGASWMSANTWEARVGMQGDPLGDRFQMTSTLPRVTGSVKTGLELLSRKGVEVKAEYDLRFARHYRSQTGILRMAVHF